MVGWMHSPLANDCGGQDSISIRGNRTVQRRKYRPTMKIKEHSFLEALCTWP